MAADTNTSIRLMTFSQTTLHDYASGDVDEILSKVNRDECAWIQVARLHDVTTTTRILEFFGLPLSIADQIEDSSPLEAEAGPGTYLLKKFRCIVRTEPAADAADVEEPAVLIKKGEADRFHEAVGTLILGKTFLLLFGDRYIAQLADKARAEFLSGKRKIQGVDHLLYRLLRAFFIDNYLVLFRRFFTRIQDTEEVLLRGTTDAAVYRDVIRLRRELNPFERSLLYATDYAEILIHETPELLGDADFGHIAKNLDSDANKLKKEFGVLYERSSELIQMFRDNVDTQLNNTMRTLTVVSTMFLPLGFITGFFGMNVRDMPAAGWGLPLAIGLMIMSVLGVVIYARKRKWF